MTPIVMACAVIAPVGLAGGPGFELDWWSIDGGGTMTAAGGDFELLGTVGQHDSSPVLLGGAWEVVGGFWGLGTPCAGDINGDGAVNLEDLQLLLFNFGQMSPHGDFTGDGVVNLNDLQILLFNFGVVC